MLHSFARAAGYYHENFIRGEPHLARLINRQKRKGTGPRKPADIQNEPNFYAMDPIGSQQANVPQTDNATSPRVSSGAIGIARPPSLLDNTHASFQQCRKTCPLVVEHYNHGVQPHDHSLRSALGWPLLSSQIAPSPPRSYLMNGDDVCQHQKFVGQEDPVESRYLDPAKHYGASQLKQQHLLDEDIISCAFNFSDSFGSSGAV